jgi:hypothetical protein
VYLDFLHLRVHNRRVFLDQYNHCAYFHLYVIVRYIRFYLLHGLLYMVNDCESDVSSGGIYLDRHIEARKRMDDPGLYLRKKPVSDVYSQGHLRNEP